MAKAKTTSIILKGYMSVGDAERLKTEIKKAFAAKPAKIYLDVSHLEDIDVSIIQLLYALYKEAGEKIQITIVGEIVALVKKSLYNCGLIADENVQDAIVIEAIKNTVRSSS